jgi:quinol monooxygenase YgiN
MSDTTPVAVTVLYRVKQGQEREFLNIVKRHAPALKQSGLITQEPVRLNQGKNIRSGKHIFIETFQWKNEKASQLSHQTPEIMAVWEPMGPLLEDLEIYYVEPVGK